MNLPILRDVKDLTDKRVLLRVDFNVPINDGEVVDDFRIKMTLPTIKLLQSAGAKTVLISHTDSGRTLKPVFNYLSRSFKVSFVSEMSELAEAQKKLRSGGLILFENIRNFSGEEKNDLKFAKRLAKHGDIFVNEAFSTSHRSHASIVGLPLLLPHFAGLLFASEVEKLSEAFAPPRPALLILGGAKFETKLSLVKKFIKIYDAVYICGALANDIFKLRGLSVGSSNVSVNLDPLSFLRNIEGLLVPDDVAVVGRNGLEQKSAKKILADDKIVDIGPHSLSYLIGLVKKSKFVLWNGTLGICEQGFSGGTEKLAVAIVGSKAPSVVGGGDTTAALDKKGLLDKFGFVSTGGGAMLQFLSDGTLPGIEALEKSL